MNNFYVRWCKAQGQTPKADYAFKCMGGANNGADLIEPMRGSGERAFIAGTVDLLETGEEIERLNAVVFFRYLQSPIKFYQMVGRGTRIPWFDGMDASAAAVLRALGQQFALGGTEALETPTLWEVPEIRRAGGLDALRVLGKPMDVVVEAKGRLFGVCAIERCWATCCSTFKRAGVSRPLSCPRVRTNSVCYK